MRRLLQAFTDWLTFSSLKIVEPIGSVEHFNHRQLPDGSRIELKFFKFHMVHALRMSCMTFQAFGGKERWKVLKVVFRRQRDQRNRR